MKLNLKKHNISGEPNNPVKEDSPLLLPTVNFRNTRLAAGSALLFAFELGILTSFSAPATADMKKLGSRFQAVTPDQITWIGSLHNLGCIFGKFFAGYTSQTFGRKAVLMYTAVFYLSSWLVIAYAPTITWIYAGRLIGGICAGASFVAVPSYIVEIAPPSIRGQLASGFQIALSFGVLFIMNLGIVLRWSWLAISGAVVVAFASCSMLFMPESPPWLVRASRLAEAKQGLQFLRGPYSDAEKELQLMINNINDRKEEKVSWRDVLDPELYKPISIAFCLVFFQQACGSSPLTSYVVAILQDSDSSVNPFIGATIIALVQVIGTILSGSLMDRSGRRRLFITSGSFMCMSLAMFGAYNYFLFQDFDLEGFHYLPLLCLILYFLAYSLGNGPIPYVMIPEIISLKYRSTVMAATGIFLSTLGFVTNKVFEDMRTTLGDYGVYWVFSFFSFLSAVFGYIFLPETKGLTICQITHSFSSTLKK